MLDLRAALEKLDEALDSLEEQATRPQMPIISPRSPSEIYRTEITRLLDETIVDVQNMLEQAA